MLCICGVKVENTNLYKPGAETKNICDLCKWGLSCIVEQIMRSCQVDLHYSADNVHN